MLDSASSWVRLASFGRSPQGRVLPLVIVSRDRAFTPAAARRTGKAIVLIQAGIHAGEIDGKDAALLLMRDIAIRKDLAHLLDHALLLMVPIFNVDGHERFGAYNRINQNGPVETGWRVTAQNLNLNRDYMKADAPEMRAMLRLFTHWLPDLLIDCHVTDGIDFQYDVTYLVESGPTLDPAVRSWLNTAFLPSVLPAVERAGHKIFWYVFPREDHDLSKGLEGGGSSPRFSTGYAALQNRPALLIETHMLKPYATRVHATYALLKAALESVNASIHELRSSVAAADARTVRAGLEAGTVFPLRLGLGPRETLRRFAGVRLIREFSGISGGMKTVYTGEPFEVDVPFRDEITVLDSTRIPAAYLVPQEWTQVLDVLRAHSIVLDTLARPVRLPVGSYRFADVQWRQRPFEGRHASTYTVKPLEEERSFPAGTVVVRTAQRGAKVAVHLLEPQGEDALAAWGFFDALFEQKEYAEEYVMEKIGPGVLASDPGLQQEFRERIAADTAFARSPRARLNWLYQRSPWGDRTLNLYPIGRVAHGVDLPTIRQHAGTEGDYEGKGRTTER
jgi:hypothetical protein